MVRPVVGKGGKIESVAEGDEEVEAEEKKAYDATEEKARQGGGGRGDIPQISGGEASNRISGRKGSVAMASPMQSIVVMPLPAMSIVVSQCTSVPHVD